MTFLAHTENEKGEPHLLRDHLARVGDLASELAAAANPYLEEAARWTGLLHDLGKYREAFQEYLVGNREGGVDTHHAVYGAAFAFDRTWLGPAFAIAGHHAGLHDCDDLQSFVSDPKYKTTDRVAELIERFEAEVRAVADSINEPAFVIKHNLKAEFYIRMLFSALVDADFLDTEFHYKCAPRAPQKLRAAELLNRLVAEKQAKPQDSELNELRNEIFEQCLAAAEREQGFFSLTVPTGGGKTLSSMAFALRHAERHNLRRVIVVIPYLSIIEQNAAEYRRIFDPENRGIVIEHHSAVAPRESRAEDATEPRLRSPLEYAAENWDAPIIVTTSVQFLESLFANRPSRCRKLHNIARSIVILDEVQTLPSHLLNPVLNVFRELRESYGVSFVFSTATQPAFRKTAFLVEGFNAGEVSEITSNTDDAFSKLRRVRFRLPEKGESVDWHSLAERIASHRQALAVVNVRRHAFELWNRLRELIVDERDTVFHLSSAMCAEHRLDVLGAIHNPHEGSIRHRLSNGEPCRVVSTQLVEAGVDFDFPVVYRAIGPLDSIVQAAGRCNREGKLRDCAGNPMLGEVFVFRPEEHSLPRGVYRAATDITATLLERTDAERLATDHALFANYFSQLYQSVPLDYERDRESSIQEDRENLRFRKVARKAWVIPPDESVSVVVPYGRGEELVEEIRNRERAKGQPRFDAKDLRRLQRFMVNLHRRHFDLLRGLGQLGPIIPNVELYVLSEASYDKYLGVVIEERPMEDYIL